MVIWFNSYFFNADPSSLVEQGYTSGVYYKKDEFVYNFPYNTVNLSDIDMDAFNNVNATHFVSTITKGIYMKLAQRLLTIVSI